MCRVLAYIGQPILIDDLPFKTDRSLVSQTYDPRMIEMLNLVGSRLAAWGEQLQNPPLLYKSTDSPFFYPNLKNTAENIITSGFIAHIRGLHALPQQKQLNNQLYILFFMMHWTYLRRIFTLDLYDLYSISQKHTCTINHCFKEKFRTTSIYTCKKNHHLF